MRNKDQIVRVFLINSGEYLPMVVWEGQTMNLLEHIFLLSVNIRFNLVSHKLSSALKGILEEKIIMYKNNN